MNAEELGQRQAYQGLPQGPHPDAAKRVFRASGLLLPDRPSARRDGFCEV
jgi:hypothetical protein